MLEVRTFAHKPPGYPGEIRDLLVVDPDILALFLPRPVPSTGDYNVWCEWSMRTWENLGGDAGVKLHTDEARRHVREADCSQGFEHDADPRPESEVIVLALPPTEFPELFGIRFELVQLANDMEAAGFGTVERTPFLDREYPIFAMDSAFRYAELIQ